MLWEKLTNLSIPKNAIIRGFNEEFNGNKFIMNFENDWHPYEIEKNHLVLEI